MTLAPAMFLQCCTLTGGCIGSDVRPLQLFATIARRAMYWPRCTVMMPSPSSRTSSLALASWWMKRDHWHWLSDIRARDAQAAAISGKPATGSGPVAFVTAAVLLALALADSHTGSGVDQPPTPGSESGLAACPGQ